VLFVRKRDDRREATDHLLRLRRLIRHGGVGVEFKPSLTQSANQPPRWLALLRSRDSADRVGRVSFNFYRSDDPPTPYDLLHVLDDILEACHLGDGARLCLEPSRLHIDLGNGLGGDHVSADLVLNRA
jgi:hypothetical protein